MLEENDWRLQGQETYLKRVPLWWRRYSRYSASWEHDHCEFCWAKFMEEDHPAVLYYLVGDIHRVDVAGNGIGYQRGHHFQVDKKADT